jgi:hypothetical protein
VVLGILARLYFYNADRKSIFEVSFKPNCNNLIQRKELLKTPKQISENKTMKKKNNISNILLYINICTFTFAQIPLLTQVASRNRLSTFHL